VNVKSLVTDEKLKQAFGFFDKDGSGKISIAEIKQVLGVKKKLIDDKVWNDLIGEADENGDGEISYEEFKKMMTTLVNDELSKNVNITPQGILLS
jgi:Ca2+-binding EF-hand superfamily protein